MSRNKTSSQHPAGLIPQQGRRSRGALARAAFILAACAALSGSALVDPASIEAGGAEYKTAEAHYGTILSEMTETGTVYRPTCVDVRCELDNARVAEISLTRADIIEQGTKLGVLRSESSRADLAATSLSLERTQEAYADGVEEREEAIRERQAALQEMDPAEREIARLEIRKMEIALEDYILRQEKAIADLTESEAEQAERLEDVVLYAPVTGSIDHFSYLQPGESVAKGQVLLTLRTDDPTLIRIEDPDGKWRYGMTIDIDYGSRSNQKTVRARIISADNVLSPTDAQGYAYAQLLEDVPAEDLTQIKARGEEFRLDNVLLVPRTAHALAGGKQQVSIKDSSSIARRYVSVGLQNKDDSWILLGLEAGQTLIIN